MIVSRHNELPWCAPLVMLNWLDRLEPCSPSNSGLTKNINMNVIFSLFEHIIKQPWCNSSKRLNHRFDRFCRLWYLAVKYRVYIIKRLSGNSKLRYLKNINFICLKKWNRKYVWGMILRMVRFRRKRVSTNQDPIRSAHVLVNNIGDIQAGHGCLHPLSEYG